jgi:hypothetical protein
MSESDPDLPEVIDALIERQLRAFHVGCPGTIEKVWKDECAVDVQLSLTYPADLEDGTKTDVTLAVIPRVPLQFPGLGPFAVTCEPKRGMRVFVIFADRAVARWALSGKISTPPDETFHTTQGAIAIPGVNPFAEGWKWEEGVMLVGLNKGPFDFVALATDVKARLDAILNWANGHTHPVSTAGTATAQTGVAVATQTPLGALAEVASASVKVSK